MKDDGVLFDQFDSHSKVAWVKTDEDIERKRRAEFYERLFGTKYTVDDMSKIRVLRARLQLGTDIPDFKQNWRVDRDTTAIVCGKFDPIVHLEYHQLACDIHLVTWAGFIAVVMKPRYEHVRMRMASFTPGPLVFSFIRQHSEDASETTTPQQTPYKSQAQHPDTTIIVFHGATRQLQITASSSDLWFSNSQLLPLLGRGRQCMFVLDHSTLRLSNGSEPMTMDELVTPVGDDNVYVSTEANVPITDDTVHIRVNDPRVLYLMGKIEYGPDVLQRLVYSTTLTV